MAGPRSDLQDSSCMLEEVHMYFFKYTFKIQRERENRRGKHCHNSKGKTEEVLLSEIMIKAVFPYGRSLHSLLLGAPLRFG